MINYLSDQFAYTEWANHTLFETVADLESKDLQLPRLCAHIVNAQRIWLHRVHHEPAGFKVWDTMPVSESLQKNKESIQEWQDYLQRLPEGGLHQMVRFTSPKGESIEFSVERIIRQLHLHGAYHRGQIAILLRSFTSKIPATDYLKYNLNI